MTTTQLLAEIDRYERLPPNYDGEGSEPPTAETCERAREFVRMYGERMKKPHDSMELSINGWISIWLGSNERKAVIIISDGEISMVYHTAGWQPTKWDNPIGELFDWLEGKVTA